MPSSALPAGPSSHDPAASVSARYLALLAEVAERLLAAAGPAAMIDEMFVLIRRELRLDVFLNYRLEDDRLVLEAYGGLDAEASAGVAELRLGQAICGCVARDRKPTHVVGVQRSDDPVHAFVRGLGVDVYACTPLLHGDRLLGTLSFGRRWADRFTPDELHFLHTVCHYVALAKYRLAVEAELRAGVEARERLLGELNHRVRNALQVAVGLVAAEVSTSDGAARAALRRAVDRLQVLALAHRPLYVGETTDTVDGVTLLVDVGGGRLTLAKQDGPVRMPVERAAALAILVHTLLEGRDEARNFEARQDAGGVHLLFHGLSLPPDDAPAAERRVAAGLLHQLRATISAGPGGLHLVMPRPAHD
ncbi:MAG: GAF domain-containing protein [Sphingomonas taxi]